MATHRLGAPRRLAALAAGTTLWLVTVPTINTPTASAASTLTYVRDIVGPGLADMYPASAAATDLHYYIADPGRYRVVAVSRSTGAIDHVAGDGQSRAQGKFGAMRGVVVDSQGAVYVADTPNHRIQKFTSDLTFITTWGTRGTGPGQFKMAYGVTAGVGKGGDGQPAEVVYATDQVRVQKFTLDGNYLSEFGQQQLNQPRDLAVHPTTNDVYVVSARARQIVVFDPDGVERFRFGEEGSGPGQFKGDPRGISIDEGGFVYVTDSGNRRVLVFDSAGVYQYQVSGPGSDPEDFVDPRGLASTGEGLLLVTDMWDHSLKEFTVSGTFQRRMFGTPPPIDGVNTPRGIEVAASGRLFTTDWWNQRIQSVDADGANPRVFGKRGWRTQKGALNFPWDLTVQPVTGRIFIANRESHEIEVWEPDGTWVSDFGSRGSDPGKFVFPQGIAFAPDGSLVVADSGNHRLQRFEIDENGNGTFVASYGEYGTKNDGPGRLNIPSGVSVATDGTIWVADKRNHSIQELSPEGTWTRYEAAGTDSGFKAPWGVTVAPDGTIWVADSGKNRLVQMSAAGDLLQAVTGKDLGSGPLRSPSDVAFGPSGQVYVSDTWNNRVVELADSGALTDASPG